MAYNRQCTACSPNANITDQRNQPASRRTQQPACTELPQDACTESSITSYQWMGVVSSWAAPAYAPGVGTTFHCFVAAVLAGDCMLTVSRIAFEAGVTQRERGV